VKWFLIGFVCLLCSASWVRGDAAGDLYNRGITKLQSEQYESAAVDFDSIITGYPLTQNIDDVQIEAGFAWLHAGKFANAVARLSKLAADTKKPQYQTTALYFTALAQFSMGQKETDKTKANTYFSNAVTTLTTLTNLITTAPTPDNKSLLEQAIYYRGLAQYLRGSYDDAEKDLIQLTQSPQFAASLSLPDYFLLLGSMYAIETNEAVTAKKPDDEIRAKAKKALDVFDHISKDPNALVQANEANMSKGEILFMIAQMDSTSAGYEAALQAYRQVRRKADMIPLQQDRLDQLRKKAALQARANISLTSLANDISLLIAREDNRLNDLKKGDDPIVQALIRMAECYMSTTRPDGTHESDEARTILHRLAHAPLTADQQKEVDFQTLYSYALGGQTDQAQKAYNDYTTKHAGDSQAASLAVLIAGKLMERKDYADALTWAQRSIQDFPNGPNAFDAVTLQAQALTRLGRIADSKKIVDDFLKANSASPKAITMLLSRAQNEEGDGNLDAAVADYKQVKDTPSASPALQASADVGYIHALQSQKKYDDVIAEAKAFETKNPDHPSLPTVMLLAALAMDQKHDPGAIAALQTIAQKFPKDDTASYALFYVVVLDKQANNVPAMIQAAADLRKAYPEAYTSLAQAADMVSGVLIPQKKFDDAIALYQPLTNAPKPDVAAAALNKIAGILLAASNVGHYQSMALDERPKAVKRLSDAEQAYLETLKKFPDQIDAVGDAFEGLVTATKQRKSWGLLKEADMEGALGKLGTEFTTPEMQARFEMAKAGLVFIIKDGVKQYPVALDRFKKVMAANPGLHLTRQEADQFGELLLAAQDYPTASKVYQDLLDNADPNDAVMRGYAYYGLGATDFAQGKVTEAKVNFLKLKALPGAGLWHPHILDAHYGIALADEQSGQPADIAEAKQLYNELMTSPAATVALRTQGLLGFGRLLEKAGFTVKSNGTGPNEFAVHYYRQPHVMFYGPTAPELCAEGLYDAGQAYEKAGDKANAKAQYDEILKTYGMTAPDWATKAQAAEVKLVP